METTVFDVVGNVFQIVGVAEAGITLSLLAEFAFETLDQCWQAAQAFNEISKEQQQSMVMVCWPNPSAALEVSL